MLAILDKRLPEGQYRSLPIQYRSNMNVSRYLHFIAILEAGNFGRAAERLGMQQAPLSQSIARLERDLGVRLFTRTHKSVALTRAGEAFAADARITVAAAERAAARARAAANPDATLRVGSVSLALFEAYPEWLVAARAADVRVELSYESTNEQLRQLANGRLDFGFVTPPFDLPQGLTLLPVAEEPVIAAIPEKRSMRAHRATLEALHRHLILFPRSEGPFLYDSIMTMFRSRGLSPRLVGEAPASMLAALAMVAAGIGCTLVPRAIARHVAVRGLRYRPLTIQREVPAWPIALVYAPHPSGSAAAGVLDEWRARTGRTHG